MRFEFEVGDLVECIVQRRPSNLSMHEARRAYLQPPDTIPAVVIGKDDEVFDGVALGAAAVCVSWLGVAALVALVDRVVGAAVRSVLQLLLGRVRLVFVTH